MTLSENLDNLYLDTLAELTELLLFKDNTEASYELMSVKYNEYIETFEAQIAEKGKSTLLDNLRISISARQNGMHNLDKVKQQFVNRINKSVIIHACSLFDYFLNQTLFLILSENPQLISNEKRTIQYYELVKYTKEELLSSTIERFIHDISYKSIADRIKNLNEMFSLKLDFSETEQPATFFSSKINLTELTEIFSIRNMLIHNQGVINRLFIENNKTTSYKCGDKVNLDTNLIQKYVISLSKYASCISRQTSKNFF